MKKTLASRPSTTADEKQVAANSVVQPNPRVVLDTRLGVIRIDGKAAVVIRDEHPREEPRRYYYASARDLVNGWPSFMYADMPREARERLKALKEGHSSTDRKVIERRLERMAKALCEFFPS